MATKMCFCRNCGRYKVDTGRKLCGPCRRTAGVLDRFPCLSKQNRTRPNEKVTCMACGVPSPCGNRIQVAGWFSRESGCGVDVQCPPCMGRWGWPPLRPYKYPGESEDAPRRYSPRVHTNHMGKR